MGADTGALAATACRIAKRARLLSNVSRLMMAPWTAPHATGQHKSGHHFPADSEEEIGSCAQKAAP